MISSPAAAQHPRDLGWLRRVGFTELAGMPPSANRRDVARATAGMPPCVAKQVTGQESRSAGHRAAGSVK